MDDLREQPTRRRILEFVATHPGASAREVQRSLSLGWGETAYHLEKLREGSALQRDRAGRRDYFFPKDFSLTDKQILVALQSSAERTILLTLAREPDLSFAEATERLEMSRSTLSFHLKFLLAGGLVEINLTGGVRRYRLHSPGRLLELYRLYRESWGDRWVDRFAAAFGGLVRD